VISCNNSVLLLYACAHEISLKYLFPEQNAIEICCQKYQECNPCCVTTFFHWSERCKHVHQTMHIFLMKHTSYSFNMTSKNTTFIPTWHILFYILIFSVPIYSSIKFFNVTICQEGKQDMSTLWSFNTLLCFCWILFYILAVNY
jgi:hypothetical protein